MDYFRITALMCLTFAERQIPFDWVPCHDGYKITFPWCNGDIAMHSGTYGAEKGMVETYQFPWDKDDVTMMTPIQAVFSIFEYHHKILQEALDNLSQK